MRCSGVDVSAPKVEEPQGEVRHQLPSGGGGPSRQGDTDGDAALAATSPQRQVDRRSVADVQPEAPGLAPILGAGLSLSTGPDYATTGPLAGPLGLSEVQEAAWACAQGDAWDRTDFPA